VLRAVPSTPNNDSDSDDIPLATITDTHVEFTGGVSKLSFNPKSGDLQVLITLTPESGVSNRDLDALRRRLLTIRLTPLTRAKGGTPSSATIDPVKARLIEERFARAWVSWLTDHD
jgi:hypothetical protein